MNNSESRQIVISGVGGQGVLFITRLLAEASIGKGLPVFTSETHGMAQRGGTVVSHLKVGNFFSPMIRPFKADGLIALKAENISPHSLFLKKDAWIVANTDSDAASRVNTTAFFINADNLAKEIENPKAVNLILLGFAMARISSVFKGDKKLFCSIEDLKTILKNRLADKKVMLEASIKAIETGYNQR